MHWLLHFSSRDIHRISFEAIGNAKRRIGRALFWLKNVVPGCRAGACPGRTAVLRVFCHGSELQVGCGCSGNSSFFMRLRMQESTCLPPCCLMQSSSFVNVLCAAASLFNSEQVFRVHTHTGHQSSELAMGLLRYLDLDGSTRKNREQKLQEQRKKPWEGRVEPHRAADVWECRW